MSLNNYQTHISQNSSSKISIDDFTLLSVIGKGSYAKVVLVRKKDNGELFAMKILKKENVEKGKQMKHVKTERDVLLNINHPFVINFFYSFQNERKLFFALEYCPGGELFNLLQKKKKFTEDQARFYSAQMVQALEHLHQKDIIYRDLKPENVLIDKTGYIRITDFGLSRMDVKDPNEAKSICGTPEYLAPEIILKQGYGKPVDWWTLGSIIYEMLVGIPPFYTTDRQELFKRIQFSSPKYPGFLSKNAKDLIESQLKKDPTKRLGTEGEANSIKTNPWFEGVDWRALYEKQYPAPFTPKIQHDNDLSNFDPEFTDIAINSMSMNERLADVVNQNYTGFSWNRDNNNLINDELKDDHAMMLEL